MQFKLVVVVAITLTFTATAVACDLEGGGYARFSAFGNMTHKQAAAYSTQYDPLPSNESRTPVPPAQVSTPVAPVAAQPVSGPTKQPSVQASLKPVVMAAQPAKR